MKKASEATGDSGEKRIVKKRRRSRSGKGDPSWETTRRGLRKINKPVGEFRQAGKIEIKLSPVANSDEWSEKAPKPAPVTLPQRKAAVRQFKGFLESTIAFLIPLLLLLLILALIWLAFGEKIYTENPHSILKN